MTEEKNKQAGKQEKQQGNEQQEKKQRSKKEEFKIAGGELVDKIKELIHEGNIRRISIKNEEGKTLIEIPLAVGLVGGAAGIAFMPVLAAVGAIAALVARLTVVVEKDEE